MGACRPRAGWRRYYGTQRFNFPESNACPNRYCCSTANNYEFLRVPDKMLVSRRVTADGVLSPRMQETPKRRNDYFT